MDISIVIPVFNEEENVLRLHDKLTSVLKKITSSYEIIFVDDGSTDTTLEKLLKLKKKDAHVKVVPFQRNFGKALALMAGFKESKGEIVFTMDGDLQDDPEEIPKFIAKLNEGYDLVSGWKYKRYDPITKTIPSKFFNWLTAKVTGVKIHDSNCGFKAYKKRVLEHIRIYGELHRYIPALVHWKGFKVGEVKVRHHPRKFGKSKYGIERLVKGFLDLITVKFLMTYTSRPLHFFGPIGLLSSLFGFIIGAYILTLKLLTGTVQSKYPLIMLSVLLIVLGVQFISIGLIGEMIVGTKNNDEQPSYLIKKLK